MIGGELRRGTENIYTKLKNRDILVDMEVVVVKIYSYFYIYALRVEKLEICDSADVEYKQMLGYLKSRFLR